jgi:hypothetical protein
MKNIISIFALALLVNFSALAQCTPDPAYANASGSFFPDSLAFITDQAASANVDYVATIDIRTIVDTTITAGGFDATVIIDAFKIHQINGAPAGFTFTGGGATFEQTDPRAADFNDVPDSTWWNVYGTPGDVSTLSSVQGCISITASAATITGLAPATGFTDYPIEILVDARIANAPGVEFLVSNGTWLREEPVGQGPLLFNDYVLRVYAVNPNGPCTPPSVLFAGLNASYSASDSPVTLTGAPAGGTFYGSGVSGNQFDPAAAGLGTHGITYVFEDLNDCLGVYSLCTSVDVQVGVDNPTNIAVDNGLDIYPNPSTGNFNLTLEKASGVVSYTVYDARGREIGYDSFVANGVVNKTINLDQQTDGVYTIQVITPTGTVSQKLVKE